jgi:hypothetical protein
MRSNHERQIIDFDQILREIQEERMRRLGEILEGPALSEPVREAIERENRIPRVFDLFIPPGAR